MAMKNENGRFTLHVSPEIDSCGSSEPKELLVMLSLEAPENAQSKQLSEKRRTPLDICCVLDISGSMSGKRIELVKKTMEFVIDNLTHRDRLCIVTFSTSVKDALGDFTTMDESGKSRAMQVVASIQAGGSTNLCGGLVRGIKKARAVAHNAATEKDQKEDKKAQDPKLSRRALCSVLLFTDGQANVGAQSTQEICREMLDPESPADGITSRRSWKQMSNSNLGSTLCIQQQMSCTPPAMAPRLTCSSRIKVKQASNHGGVLEASASQKKKFRELEAQMARMGLSESQRQKILDRFEKEFGFGTKEKNLKGRGLQCKKEEIAGPLPCTVHTFGFGNDHNAPLLQAISEAGTGTYYFVEDSNQIGACFADCLGGLLSTVAQKLVITLQAVPPSFSGLAKTGSKKKLQQQQQQEQERKTSSALSPSIVEVLCGRMYRVHEAQKGKQFTVSIGDLQAGERRDLLFKVRVPAFPHDWANAPFVTCRVNFEEPLDGSKRELTCTGTLSRLTGCTTRPRRKDVDEQHNRYLAARAMETSEALAKACKLREARESLKRCSATIKGSVSKGSPISSALLDDLLRCGDGLRNQSAYLSVGSKMLNCQLSSHYTQRCSSAAALASSSWGSERMYTTVSKTRMKKRAKTINDSTKNYDVFKGFN